MELSRIFAAEGIIIPNGVAAACLSTPMSAELDLIGAGGSRSDGGRQCDCCTTHSVCPEKRHGGRGTDVRCAYSFEDIPSRGSQIGLPPILRQVGRRQLATAS
jgi:hypothetical protein